MTPTEEKIRAMTDAELDRWSRREVRTAIAMGVLALAIGVVACWVMSVIGGMEGVPK